MPAKQESFFTLFRTLGLEVTNKHGFPWLTNHIAPADTALWKIFLSLNGDPDGMQGKQGRRLVPDGYLPAYKRIVEFDELQHFTAYRRLTFNHYPPDAPMGFDISAWRAWCDQYEVDALRKGAWGYRQPKAEFPFDGGRAAQRALFDAVRDLAPLRHDLNPTIRIAEFEVPSLLKDPKQASKELQQALSRRL